MIDVRQVDVGRHRNRRLDDVMLDELEPRMAVEMAEDSRSGQ